MLTTWLYSLKISKIVPSLTKQKSHYDYVIIERGWGVEENIFLFQNFLRVNIIPIIHSLLFYYPFLY